MHGTTLRFYWTGAGPARDTAVVSTAAAARLSNRALLASLRRRLVVRAVDAPVATDLQAELSSPAAVS